MKRLSMTACPACEHVNVDDAPTCAACGSPLVTRCPSCRTINARTRSRCHYCAALLAPEAPDEQLPQQPAPALGANAVRIDRGWADDVEGNELETVRDDATLDAIPASGALPSPAPPAPPAAMPAWNLTLRADRMPVPPRQKPARPPASPAGPSATPPAAPAPAPVASAETRAAVVADPPASAPATPPPVDAASAAQSHWGDLGGLNERKAKVRAAVRRSRLRHQRRHMLAAEAAVDVLLVEPDAAARARLAALLLQFGFHPHAVAGVADAAKMLGVMRFAAAFVGVGVMDGDAADFCARLRATDGAEQRPHAVVAMIDADHHAERVRAELAGADLVLVRPVARGQLAQALEECGIPLPDDPRKR